MIDFVPFVFYVALMAITPGPNNVMLAASGLHYGFVRTLPHILGIASGLVLQLLVICLGLGELFLVYPFVKSILKVVGCLYLLYLSYKILGSQLQPSRMGRGRPLHFFEAVLFQFVNPKAWVFVMSVAALFLPSDRASLFFPALVLAFGTGAVILCCIPLWAGCGHALRRFLGNPIVLTVFNVVIAVSLAGTALYLLLF